VSFPNDLLEVARDLADSDPAKPRQAALRRAVSTAYYALFHYLGEESAKLLIGATHLDKARRDLAKRAIAHTKLKDVCKEFEKNTPKPILQPFWAKISISGDPSLGKICKYFIELQELRHIADYDLMSPIRKSDAHDACDKAQVAMSAWTVLRRDNPQAAMLFATAVLLWPGLASR